MSQSNSQVVRDYLEQVFNKKHYDRIYDFCSRDCFFHIAPYVGLGIAPVSTPDDRLLIKDVSASGPAAGLVLVGDELVKVKDATHTWDTFKDLNSNAWGQGMLDTEVALTVKRSGELLEIPLKRSWVRGYDLKLSVTSDTWEDYNRKYTPDYHLEIGLLFESGDLVACYAVDTATHTQYKRTAIWDECYIYRVANGKIVEIWGADNSFSQMKQWGYKIEEPA